MEYGIIVVMIICGVLLFIEIDELKKQVKSQQKQIEDVYKRQRTERESKAYQCGSKNAA